MSKKELGRVEILALRRSGQLTQSEAGRRLGLSERQVRRLERRAAAGPEGLRSARRGRPSNRRIDPATVQEASRLIAELYPDFAPTLASEYLAAGHGIILSKETVRKIMIQARLWRPKRGPKVRIYALRQRRERFGELIQIDGSLHPWFEDRGPICCLLVFIDDATSSLTGLRFVERECTLGYMQVLHAHILEHGLPMTLYSDQHGIFRVNSGAAREEKVSQFGRALATLGIESICANSPQAKGRVERANSILQDRLIKAMRVARIDTIEAANHWLPTFRADYNRRFAVAPFSGLNAHVPYGPDQVELRRTLSLHYPRRLSQNLSCQFHSTLLQVQPEVGGQGLRGAKVVVAQHFDASIELLWRFSALPFTLFDHTARAPAILTHQEATRSDGARPKPPPAPKSHPWRTSPIAPKSTLENLFRWENYAKNRGY